MSILRSIGLALLMAMPMLACAVIPAQDCGNVSDVTVEGRVTRVDGEPINAAQIVIESGQESRCYNAASFQTLTLVTDENGQFDGVIPIISEDEGIIMTVSADGYGNFTSGGTYVLFDDFVSVTLLVE